MNHKIWYDHENEILRFEVDGDFLQSDIDPVSKEILRLLEGKPYKQMLVSMDASSGKFENRETRTLANQSMQNGGITEIAYNGASAGVRMVVRVLLKTGDVKTNGEFFNNQEDAINWLKSKR